ncbi:hypothetical protein [Verrucomicrobium sp. BvORR106]|uniref:hypothetical protein n=1 Tax=Verrucomicrobium sp. BvORR106 TaxID=1403819 RepID=UPI002240E919|nr:hypothetical protein [Verrucomicrobium sp. BvORR106]
MAHQLPVELQKLRRQLEASRWDLRCAVDDLEHSLNLPSRAREAIASHPMRYALYALAGGALASRVIPMVFRMARPTMSAKMLRTMLQAVVPLAAPYVLQRLSQMAPTPSLPVPGTPAVGS